MTGEENTRVWCTACSLCSQCVHSVFTLCAHVCSCVLVCALVLVHYFSFTNTPRVPLLSLGRLVDTTFAPMLKSVRCRSLLDFRNKRMLFRQSLKKAKKHSSRRFGSLKVGVRRAHIFEDSYHQLRLHSAQEMRGKLNIAFRGEEGIDAGGVTREWYLKLSQQIFNPNYALFTQSAESTIGPKTRQRPRACVCTQSHKTTRQSPVLAASQELKSSVFRFLLPGVPAASSVAPRLREEEEEEPSVRCLFEGGSSSSSSSPMVKPKPLALSSASSPSGAGGSHWGRLERATLHSLFQAPRPFMILARRSA